jgi:CRP-like cAMP-binding protein/CheY-like chemotaxis protein
MKKILIIESDKTESAKISKLLVLANYAVVVTENATDGVKKARTENPDLIICGIILTDLDGYDVLRILKKSLKTRDIPFIFFTEKSDNTHLRKAMNLGADDFIAKPLEDSDLFAAIEMCLKRSANLNKRIEDAKMPLPPEATSSKGIQELTNLPKNKKEKKFVKNEEIYRENDYAEYVYFIISGKVKFEKTDTHGKHMIIRILLEGEFFGYTPILLKHTYESTAIALDDTCLSIIPKNDCLELLERNSEVSSKFIKTLSTSLVERETKLLQLAYSPIVERVATALLNCVNNCEQNEVEMPRVDTSREDLASIVGTAKESVTRELSQLRKDGIIEIKGHDVFILDSDRLKAIANGF